MLAAVILAAISYIIFLILHIYIFHRARVKRRFRALIMLCFFSIILYSFLFLIFVKIGLYNKINSLAPFGVIDIFNAIFVYFFCLVFYAHLVILFDRAVSIRMMVELDQAKDKRLTKEQLKVAYCLKDKFRYEIEDMVR